MITSGNGRRILGYIFSKCWIENPLQSIIIACPVSNVRGSTGVETVLGKIGSAKIVV
jgi:hypothetical protein